MVIKVGDTVLVYYDLLLFDAVVLKIDDSCSSSDGAVRYFVHFSEWTDNWDEWIAQENVLEDTPSNRERQKKVKEELVIPRDRMLQQNQEPQPKVSNTMPTTVPGSERLSALIGWMKTLDDALTRLDKQVKDLVREQINQEVGTVQLKKRKAEAEVQRAELEDVTFDMVVKSGDTVLVLHDSVLLDAAVQKINNPTNTEDKSTEEHLSGPRFLVHYVNSDRPDEWMSVDRVLQDTPKNRDLQLKANAIQEERSKISKSSDVLENVCGPGRLDAIVAWMNTVDDTLVRLDKDVNELLRAQANQRAQLNELERRKTEAEKKKTELEAEVLQDLKRVKVAEETALARKRLQAAGVSQEEIDTILPIKPHLS
ncbi:hypothetical protein JM18_008761 [Phytophthora kernoviae]|uniref:MSL3 chromodomain-like domain-containing protein n=1 Tax=Phytophthora kernoviae TaxID=325452 RepID=A0A921SAS1_9STRA|nr:hypothetical protein JM18_008761 [Phytophthora kernoviae]